MSRESVFNALTTASGIQVPFKVTAIVLIEMTTNSSCWCVNSQVYLPVIREGALEETFKKWLN